VAKKDKKGKSDGVEEEEASGGGKKKMIMIVGGLLAIGAVYNFVLKPAPVEDPLAMVDPELIEGEIFELPEMVINLQDGDVSYVRVGIALVLEEGTLAADFEAESAIAKDVILEDLSSRTAELLRSSQGKRDVKADLSMAIREAYDDEKVIRVLFTALVMQ
jgi:flagellar basal body-associated protein FliL